MNPREHQTAPQDVIADAIVAAFDTRYDDVHVAVNARAIAEVAWKAAAPYVAAAREEGRVERSEGFRRLLAAAGISDHEGGGGDTYYDRPAVHMLEELVAERDSLRAEVKAAERRGEGDQR